MRSVPCCVRLRHWTAWRRSSQRRRFSNFTSHLIYAVCWTFTTDRLQSSSYLPPLGTNSFLTRTAKRNSCGKKRCLCPGHSCPKCGGSLIDRPLISLVSQHPRRPTPSTDLAPSSAHSNLFQPLTVALHPNAILPLWYTAPTMSKGEM